MVGVRFEPPAVKVGFNNRLQSWVENAAVGLLRKSLYDDSLRVGKVNIISQFTLTHYFKSKEFKA